MGLLGWETSRNSNQSRRDDWPILLLDAHPGYIVWDQFLRNQQRLDDNRTLRTKDRRDAIREGAVPLQGIVLCGRCGRRMAAHCLDNGPTPI